MRELTILQVNDLHGYLAPHAELFDLTREQNLRSGGGLARLATIFHSVRREAAGAVVTLDNGDTFHGTMAAVNTHGQALVSPMRALDLDAMTLHWEMAYGLPRVHELAAQLPYPLLAANIHPADQSLAFQPCVVVNRGGVTVGVIGLGAVVAGHLLAPGEREHVEFSMGEAELRRLVPLLRREQGVQLVVVLSHLGFPQDCKLAAVVPGIDVILSGHTHNRMTTPAVIGSTVIMQSGAHGSFAGRLDLRLSETGISGWTHALLPVDDAVEQTSDVEALVEHELAPFAAARATVVGDTACVLHRYAMLESTMDNLLLEATAAAAGTPVAFSNGWRYGAPIPAGPLTLWDLWNIVPANPPVSIVTLTGAQLRQLLEQNIEATFACDPWQQRGGYLKRCLGIELLVKLENPAGQRIQQLTVAGADVADRQTVQAAFLGAQAVPEGVGSNRRSIGASAVTALEDYVRAKQTVEPSPRRPIRLI